MKYKIGDVSRAFSISKNALRYYEDKGIILPVHREGSDYRYYDNEQMHQMGSLKKLRNLGLSVDEVREFFEGVSFERLCGILSGRLEEEKREIRKRQYLAARLQEDLSRMKDTASQGKIGFRDLPERWELQLTSIENLVEDRELQKVAPGWFDSVFPVMNIHRLDLTKVRQGSFEPFYALCVDIQGAELLGLETASRYIVRRPAQKCLNLFIRFSLSGEEREGWGYEKQCAQLLKACDARSLTAVDALYFNIVFVYADLEGGSVVFGDLYLPVEEEEK